jgi:leucine dehydrogenase
MFAMLEAYAAQSLHFAQDTSSGLRAMVAIHSSRPGVALGGCRFMPFADEQAAAQDALQMARSMSYRAALAGLAYGGGAAVILRPAHVDNRAELFEAFGRMLESLAGVYLPVVDVGTSCADMDCIAQYTQHVTCTTGSGNPSLHTALGVFAGIRAAAQARLGSDDLQGVRIAVQGLGQVGYALAELLAAEGAELLVSERDQGKLQLAVDALGATPIPCEQLLGTPCEIFAPCATGVVLDPGNVGRLHCMAVAGAASNPLSGPQVAEALESRGILYAPDYVINAGGLIHAALSHAGAPAAAITEQLALIPQRLTDIFAHAQAEKCSPERIARKQAEDILRGSCPPGFRRVL